MLNSDFEKSVLGMEHHLRSVPRNHALFVPEVLVELERKHDTKHPGVEGTTLTNDHHVTLLEQEEQKLAEKVKRENHYLDKESIKTVLTAKESISNVDRQKKEYERLQAKAKEEKNLGSTGRNLPQNYTYEDVQRELSERQYIKAIIHGVDPASMNLGVGSLIQIPSSDQERLRYGTIKWIGLLPNVQGKIAGIELVNQ